MKVHMVTIEPKDFARHGVKVIGSYRFAHRYDWRVRIGLLLLRLAASVAGFGFQEEKEGDE